ncbi:hypothetical protein ACH5RR_032531 [Cinchona calisaya]|uniref:Uncharacterized protein n=1 Tax=Cinchona calisaya TaxID=153742 RepID=A0ABD2YIB0_9GENT
MANKRTRSTRSEETFDPLKFVSQAGFDKYKEKLEEKTTILEHVFNLFDSWLGFIHDNDYFEVELTRRGWVRYGTQIQPGALSLVHEFYANASGGIYKFVSVRGIPVSYSQAQINSVIGTLLFSRTSMISI